MRSRILGLGLLSTAIAMSACEGTRPRPGGGTIQSNDTFTGLYVANPDHGTVTRVVLQDGSMSKIQVGVEPTRVARFKDRLYVSNRADRTVTILEETGASLRTVAVLQTGAEPFGVVANQDRFYVTASVQGEVVEYDASSFEVLRRWNVDGEPRGLALHPSGNRLVGVQAYGGKFFDIDVASGELTMHELPVHFGFDFETGNQVELSRRITGDPSFTPSGDQLAIPVLYVDNTSPIIDPNDGDDGDARRPPGGDGYQNRMNPGIVIEPVDGDGRPVPEEAVVYSVNSFVIVEENGFQTGRNVNAFPVSIAFTPDEEIALVALKGADVVVALNLVDSQNNGFGAAEAPTDGIAFPGGSSFFFLPSTSIRTGAAPVGLAILDNDVAYVHAQFDNTVEKIDLEAVRNMFGGNNSEPTPAPGQGRVSVPPGEDVPGGELVQLKTRDIFVIESNKLPAEIDRGRRLFFSTSNAIMSADGAGVSCGTCHFNGRTDGLTWNFTRGPRQTPSLAGNVSLSEPVGWQGDRPTVAEDAMMTSQGLMGGEGLTQTDANQIQAFVNFTRDVDNPFATGDEAAIQRGKSIFERSDVGCISCHNGPTYTNNAVVSMFELERAKVRPLTGIALTAPYFHDGSAATLYDVLERARDGSMGNTGSLSDLEMQDLERYLKSL